MLHKVELPRANVDITCAARESPSVPTLVAAKASLTFPSIACGKTEGAYNQCCTQEAMCSDFVSVRDGYRNFSNWASYRWSHFVSEFKSCCRHAKESPNRAPGDCLTDLDDLTLVAYALPCGEQHSVEMPKIGLGQEIF